MPDLALIPDGADAITTLEQTHPLVEERRLKLEALATARDELEQAHDARAAAVTREKEQAKAVAELEQDVHVLEARLADGIMVGMERAAPAGGPSKGRR